mmetsp:Transcript_12391/g.18694  ORF Transcript_12391/g.18694 Transcript_12391/m.18694 type:complete len:91 (+) Transcript_12391:295-567(+)
MRSLCPSFVRSMRVLGYRLMMGWRSLKKEVEGGVFPGKDYSPYLMSEEEEAKFDDVISEHAEKTKSKLDASDSKLGMADESEQLSLYGNK